jgi:hypothetical protein
MMLRHIAACGTLLLAAVASHADVTVSQTITFDSIAPFGVYTDGTFVTNGWNAAFPFTAFDQINTAKFSFASTNADYNAGIGPQGGVPSVEINVVDDSNARVGIASVNAANPDIFLNSPAQDPIYTLVRTLVADGELTVRLGGFESFFDHSESFTFGPTSTLTLTLTGTPGTPGRVPEPGSMALLGSVGFAGLVALRRGRRRK